MRRGTLYQTILVSLLRRRTVRDWHHRLRPQCTLTLRLRAIDVATAAQNIQHRVGKPLVVAELEVDLRVHAQEAGDRVDSTDIDLNEVPAAP
eukprot:COSAG03_NODE_1167_length_4661_cov_157.197109_4_plen_92_part_00